MPDDSIDSPASALSAVDGAGGAEGAQPAPASGGDAQEQPGVSVRPVAFTELHDPERDGEAPEGSGAMPLDVILDVEVPVIVELGGAELPIEHLLALKPGSIVELDRLAGEPADLVVRGHVLAQGEVIVVDDNFGLRITNIVAPPERVKNLR